MIYSLRLKQGNEHAAFKSLEGARKALARLCAVGRVLEEVAAYELRAELTTEKNYREAVNYASDLTGAYIHYRKENENEQFIHVSQEKSYARQAPPIDRAARPF